MGWASSPSFPPCWKKTTTTLFSVRISTASFSFPLYLVHSPLHIHPSPPPSPLSHRLSLAFFPLPPPLSLFSIHSLPTHSYPPPPPPTVSQFRPPVGKEVLELPAGLVDDGEDEATSAIRELREETGFEGIVTHISPIVYSDPGLSNASMRYVFMKIDGDLGSNQQPVAIPDDGEIITVHRVPVKKLLDEVEAFRDKGFEIDARLYGLALGLQFGDVKQCTCFSIHPPTQSQTTHPQTTLPTFYRQATRVFDGLLGLDDCEWIGRLVAV